MRINIAKGDFIGSLREFLDNSIDMEALYAVYWEKRKEAHTGRLPSALDHESWEAFCEDDPVGATAFIAPLSDTLLLYAERGDEQGSFDLVESGTWLPRQRVSVVVRPRAGEVKSAMQTEKLFSTERIVSE